jgi:predicted metal-dependent hydrolase
MNLPPPLPASQLPLPQWAYVPGEMDEADADHDTLWQAKVLVPSRFRDYVPARHPALRYGLALNDRGYFWEAQEILEAVWAAAPQGGRERILLRACIQIANANLRLRVGKLTTATRLFGDALRELDALGVRKANAAGHGFADGFATAQLAALLRARLALPVLSKADWVQIGVTGRI